MAGIINVRVAVIADITDFMIFSSAAIDQGIRAK
jgi:hypothetical protein